MGGGGVLLLVAGQGKERIDGIGTYRIRANKLQQCRAYGSVGPVSRGKWEDQIKNQCA